MIYWIAYLAAFVVYAVFVTVGSALAGLSGVIAAQGFLFSFLLTWMLVTALRSRK